MTTRILRSPADQLTPEFLDNHCATADMYVPGTVPKFKRVKGKKVRVGARAILQPVPELQRVQKHLIAQLKNYRVGLHPAAHAYRENRSIITAAEPHVGKRRLLRIDLKAFFATVTPEMVFEWLPRSVPQGLKDRIKNWCFLDGSLPQGAPSSPFLSNVAMYGVDKRIEFLCRNWRSPRNITASKCDAKYTRLNRIDYTRYSDDLFFSSDYRRLLGITFHVRKILRRNGFEVNERKVRLTKRESNRQYVVGIVVNEKLSCPRDLRKWLRNQLHRLIVDVVSGRCAPHHYFNTEGVVTPLNGSTALTFESLAGKVNFVNNVNPEQGAQLQQLLDIAVEAHTLADDEWSEATVNYAKKCQ